LAIFSLMFVLIGLYIFDESITYKIP